jgi:hypothetical protein
MLPRTDWRPIGFLAVGDQITFSVIQQAICFSPVSHHTLPPVITSDENRRHRINNAGILPNYVDFFCDIGLFLTKFGHSGSQGPGLMEHLPYSQHPRVDLSNGVLTYERIMLPPLAENYFNWIFWLSALTKYWILEANKRKMIYISGFWQNCEKRLLASSCLSVRPSVLPSVCLRERERER